MATSQIPRNLVFSVNTRIYRGIEAYASALEAQAHTPVVVIGNFDGVHLGHQKIFATAVSVAQKKRSRVVALTFKPHPRVALGGGGAGLATDFSFLTTYEEKLELLLAAGADDVIEQPFDRDFSSLSAKDFFEQWLQQKIQACAVVVGYDFKFGKEREGHLEGLRGWCENAGIAFYVVSPLNVHQKPVSSTAIRQALQSAEVSLANELLGYRYFYQGIVEKGDQRGRLIGFPTANIHVVDKLLLPYGVYGTRTRLDSRSMLSVTNVGVRPTFQSKPPESSPSVTIETHVMDVPPLDLYGRTIRVEFLGKIRSEKKFSGVDAIREQIKQDVQSVRSQFADS